MINKVCVKTYSAAKPDISEIARYTGAREISGELFALINSCIDESERENAAAYSVCYAESPIFICGDTVGLLGVEFKSKNLAETLAPCDRALVFACTLGIGVDRLIKKYTDINPSRALVFQAYGAERVESFTDLFLEDYALSTGVKLARRFSPGYADLPLSAQREIFAVLNPEKRIGVTLNDSLLMSPSKSVTAIAGIIMGKSGAAEKNCGEKERACVNCGADCEFRR